MLCAENSNNLNCSTAKSISPHKLWIFRIERISRNLSGETQSLISKKWVVYGKVNQKKELVCSDRRTWWEWVGNQILEVDWKEVSLISHNQVCTKEKIWNFFFSEVLRRCRQVLSKSLYKFHISHHCWDHRLCLWNEESLSLEHTFHVVAKMTDCKLEDHNCESH